MEKLEDVKHTYYKKVVRHVVTNDKFYVKDIIDTNRGVSIVLQALKDEAADARHRLFTAPVELVRKDYEIET
jgi:hypothetical protein